MNLLTRLMRLLEHSGNIGWKVHELAWNVHKLKFEVS